VRVRLNGHPRELPDGASVADAASALGVGQDARGVAVALDGEVVPRGSWSDTSLCEGAVVEVVAAIQGG
jgi:sulfur carrier protein